MNVQRLRRSLLLLAIVFSACMINSRSVFKNPNIRAVDMLNLLTMGILIGVFLVNLRLYLTYKNKTQE
jgi:hypothetical protein